MSVKTHLVSVLEFKDKTGEHRLDGPNDYGETVSKCCESFQAILAARSRVISVRDREQVALGVG
jgi:hypothetical protein